MIDRTESRLAGTVTKITDTEKIDIDKAFQTVHKLQSEIISQLYNFFYGIRVEVDENLKGRGYYLRVSPELFNEMKKQSKENNSAVSAASAVKKQG